MTITKKLLLGALVAASAIIPVASANAQGLSISVGDRGYYSHGDSYSYRGRQMYWVPGHWGPRHHWVHGYYARRDGNFHRRGWRGPSIRIGG